MVWEVDGIDSLPEDAKLLIGVKPESVPRKVCVYITAEPITAITKLFAWGRGESGGHVLRETTRRGLCGLVCPSRTSERGEEGDCVKEGGEGEGERERERALGLLLCYSPRY